MSTDQNDELIWKALADKSRRAILDLLRDSPKTTGEVCERFDMSRIAVMKHLDILEACNLISVRREGKFRWNHLNAIPIQQIYERWVKPYEAHWASQGIQLKNFVEAKAKDKRHGKRNKNASG